MDEPDRTDQPQDRGWNRPRIAARALTVGGAVVAALAVWALAVAVIGVELQVEPGTTEPETVGPAMVTIASLAAGLAGWGLLALLERLTSRARGVWTATALAALLMSLAGPLAGVSAAATATLAAMHVAVAAVLVPGLRRGTRAQARDASASS
ncbi:DUF6069 family protein [Egibacter rhizosphaerae]|uniref:DUF6069 family protein n=1 Tax=Egibacter rhizosphaerae TaxID=1670831 RepID=UPI00197A9A03|nr:DUF6069 family protein [Egibacter rhizosphaerae]